ncbi:ABC transporter ATP-binding protein [Kineosporia sp. J2-2]|uniref:ABC transporter ATP-binding protein n=1 Tax=Kineosporia corallincola TaxID=2835133 RepID=A0ABS5TT71_9ACTN|nr:ATP-binding cassette domain-containing protein [Kineosporia corallincola]MBT0774007.1 ABC transporter ATP-binding protein [Kineosporia corallincola]
MTATPHVPTRTTAVATVTGLTVHAPDGTSLLEDLGLHLAEGTVTAVLGRSGAGKTTLALALLGHLGTGLRCAAGQIEVAGHDPFTAAGRKALRGKKIGYLPQDPASSLDPRRRIGAQLLTAARIAYPGENRAGRRARVDQAARAAALDTGLLRRHPGELSGGQAQRALLAWTLVTRPRLLVLDEPTSGLDAVTAHRVAVAFTTLAWNPAVLLITHDRDLAGRVATDVLELTAGRLRPATPRERTAPPPPRARTGQDARTTAAESVPALEALDVSVERGGRRLLDAVSLRLVPGELVAVQGISGSGKTSLARALSGLAVPATGRLVVHGTPTPWDAAARARTGQPYLAYVGQDARAALNPHENVRRSLTRALASADRRGLPAPTGTAELIACFALPPDVLDRTPDRLSGGQRHRVALARALAAAPAVLICDETTAALDANTTDLVLDALLTWRRRHGTPMVLITHQHQVAARATRVLTLTGGRLQ